MKYTTKWILLCFFALCASLAAAQPVSIRASVDKTSMTMDDEAVLTVEIRGASGNMLMPKLPSMPAFNIYANIVEQQTVNFQTVTTFRFMMTPRVQGKATIGPITFDYGGRQYQTEPITVDIYRNASGVGQTAPSAAVSSRAVATAQPPSAKELPPLEAELLKLAYARSKQDFFLVAAVNDKKPYVNQTVTLVVRFYYANIFQDNAPYIKPTVQNIFMEDLGTVEGTQVLNNKKFVYQEQRYSISGVTPGKASISPAMVKYVVGGGSGFGMFDHMFGLSGGQGQEKIAQSNAITLDIRPLPKEGKPASFYGAVGSGYQITASVDRKEVEAGDAVNLTIQVRGPGNLKPTADIKLPVINGFKAYDAATSAGTLPSTTGISSFKTFKTVLVPSKEGAYNIPAISWSYFNPKTKTYRTIQTRAIPITVTPSSRTETDFDFGRRPAGGVQELGRDIHYLKTELSTSSTNVLAAVGALGALNLLAFALLLGAGLFVFVDKKALAHKRALNAACARLKKATTEQQVEDAISDYLNDKLKINTSSLQLRTVLGALQKHGVTVPTLQNFQVLWQHLEAARFAPSAQGNAAQFANMAYTLLRKIDGELK